MGRKSIVLLDATETISRDGDPVRLPGSFGRTRGLHTVSIRLQAFRGTIFLEATLRDVPDGGWFPVVPPIVLPRDLVLYRGAPDPDFPPWNPPALRTIGVTFRGNFCWLRARVDRAHLVPQFTRPDQITLRVGRLDQILLNC